MSAAVRSEEDVKKKNANDVERDERRMGPKKWCGVLHRFTKIQRSGEGRTGALERMGLGHVER